MKHRDFETGQPLPEGFLDALNEFLSAQTNVRVEKPTATSLRIPGGAGNEQRAIAIFGPGVGGWRYNTAAVTASVPGGLASGTHDIYVASRANDPAAEDAGTFDYSFGLVLKATGTTPSGTGSEAVYRKIGTFGWDGSAITALDVTVGTGPLAHAAGHVAGGADPISGLTKAQLAAAAQEAMFSPGDLKASAIRHEPTGWLRCDGRAVSRATYAALWDELRKDASGALTASSPWGDGDGTTTFNLPDFRGRALVGADNMGSAAGAAQRTTAIGAVAAVGGAATHTLTVNESPIHSHGDGTLATANESAHGHGTGQGSWPNYLVLAGSVNRVSVKLGTQTVEQTGLLQTDFSATQVGGTGAGSAHSHDVTGSTGTAGGGGSHNNVQPSAGASVLVKT